MPNWCTSIARFYGDKTNIKKLENLIKTAQSLENDPWIKENVDFSKRDWMGNLALAAGGKVGAMVLKDGKVVHDPESDRPAVPCRGTVVRTTIFDNQIEFEFEEAWAPCTDLYNLLTEVTGTSSEFMSVEPGCCVYLTTNPDEFGAMFVYDDDNEGFTLCESEETLLSHAYEQEGIKADSFETLCAQIEEFLSINEDRYISANAFEDLFFNPWYLKDTA